ncbi:hypothetical protein PWR05_07400 [Paraburkholderia sp. A2RI-6]|uniref:hypothetical protein n=1 Tax=Paraburkholderia sp. A2RI-6 TaxID=3028371 RepID=UPI003B825433
MSDDLLETDRALSCTVHRGLRTLSKAGPVDLGNFYSYDLATGLWPSRSAMASALSVSVSHISKCISISRLPKPVVEAFGGSDYVSFGLGKKLLDITRKLGTDEICKRAAKAKALKLVHASDVLRLLDSGVPPAPKNPRLWVSVERGAKSLRIQGSDAEKLISHIDALEDAIRACMFNLNLAQQVNAEFIANFPPGSGDGGMAFESFSPSFRRKRR